MANHFDEFRRAVVEDPGLTETLARADSPDELNALIRGRGFEFDQAELMEIVRANKRAWIERWLWQ